MAAKPIPDGFHTVTPYLIVDGAGKLIEFLNQAFGAAELHRSSLPDGVTMQALLRNDDSMIMMSDARLEYAAMPCMHYLYLPDVDAEYRQALQAGAPPA